MMSSASVRSVEMATGTAALDGGCATIHGAVSRSGVGGEEGWGRKNGIHENKLLDTADTLSDEEIRKGEGYKSFI